MYNDISSENVFETPGGESLASIQDVAKAAGVSVSTVSRALNNYTDVSEATRTKVRQITRDLGYIPNLNARSLSSKRQINIAMVLSGFLEDEMLNGFETMLMKGAYKYALEHGLEMSMHAINSRTQEERSYSQLCHEYGIAGGILFGLKTTDKFYQTLHSSPVPCVTFDLDLYGPKVASVGIDNAQAFGELTRYLLSCGHRKIVLVEGRKNALVCTTRREGANAAMREYGLDFSEDQIISADFMEDQAYTGTMRYFQTHSPDSVTAFLCMSDVIAFGVMKALRHLGYRIPEDYSVVGCDGLQATSYTSPMLTTVDQNIMDQGYAAAGLLHKIIKGENFTPHLTLPYTILKRESVRILD